jgi:hypothetical protein
VYAIHEESLLDAEMPSWDELCLTWTQPALLPTRLKACANGGGSTTSSTRTLEKAMLVQQAARKTSSAVGLIMPPQVMGGTRSCENVSQSNFVFTILERTSPDIGRDQMCELEAKSKKRLHTGEYGLNEN